MYDLLNKDINKISIIETGDNNIYFDGLKEVKASSYDEAMS